MDVSESPTSRGNLSARSRFNALFEIEKHSVTVQRSTQARKKNDPRYEGWSLALMLTTTLISVGLYAAIVSGAFWGLWVWVVRDWLS